MQCSPRRHVYILCFLQRTYNNGRGRGGPINKKKSEYEKELKNRASVLYGNESLKLMEITKDEFLRYDSMQISSEFWNRNDPTAEPQEKLFSRGNNIYSTDSTSFFFLNKFENLESEKTHFSKGAFQKPKRGEHVIHSFEQNIFESNKTYILF